MSETDDQPTSSAGDVLSNLPRTRPQRRSTKRGGGSAAASPRKPRSARKPAGVRPSAATSRVRATSEPPRRKAEPPSGTNLVGTAVQAAGELAQIGLSLGARALRDMASRLPRP